MVTLIPDVTVYSECPAFLDVENPHKYYLCSRVHPRNLMQSKPAAWLFRRINFCPPDLGSKLTSIPWLLGWFIVGHQYLKCPEMIPRFPLETCESTIKINTVPTLNAMHVHPLSPFHSNLETLLIFHDFPMNSQTQFWSFRMFHAFPVVFPMTSAPFFPRGGRDGQGGDAGRDHGATLPCRTGNRRSSKWPKLDGNIVGSLGGDRVGIGWDGDGDGFDQLDMEYLYQWITNINGTYHDFPQHLDLC